MAQRNVQHLMQSGPLFTLELFATLDPTQPNPTKQSQHHFYWKGDFQKQVIKNTKEVAFCTKSTSFGWSSTISADENLQSGCKMLQRQHHASAFSLMYYYLHCAVKLACYVHSSCQLCGSVLEYWKFPPQVLNTLSKQSRCTSLTLD